jgi:hypothetical protein
MSMNTSDAQLWVALLGMACFIGIFVYGIYREAIDQLFEDFDSETEDTLCEFYLAHNEWEDKS